MPCSILYEDNHLLVVDKPAGLATMGVAADRPSLLEEARSYVKHKYAKPGNVYLGIVSRLDAPVTGAVLLARTSKAAARLNEQFREGRVEKRYWALVEQPPDPADAACRDWLRHDDRHRRMHIAARTHPDAREARLSYRTLRSGPAATLLEIELETGRKHQIRLQLAHRGWPILGDRKYGSTRVFTAGIALHSRFLTFEHPVKRTPIHIESKVPGSWRHYLADR